MNTAQAQALTGVLRKGNPWLVGHNFRRVAPVFFLNSLLRDRSSPGAPERVERVLKLLHVVDPSDIEGLPLNVERPDGLSIAIRGALAADRRAFNTANGSALFPVSANLILGGASDDGLGRLARDLIDSSIHGADFANRLAVLFPDDNSGLSQVEDPVSRLGYLLAGNVPSPTLAPHIGGLQDVHQSAFDEKLAGFILNAFRVGSRIQRLSALRALAHAGYLVSILRMLQGPIVASLGALRPVVVYAGLPPGPPQEPTTVTSIASFKSVVRTSWDATLRLTENAIVVSGLSRNDDTNSQLRQSVIATLGRDLSDKIKISELLPVNHAESPQTLRQFVELGLGAGPEVLAQRLRGLATKIGFAAPDKGTGGIRIALDTPLLGVLVDGLISGASMPFEQFVSALRTELGLVVGVGEDDSFVPELETETFGSHGRSIYEVLMENEQSFRQRLLRSGLARTYSDAHTEVMSSDA